MKAKVEHESIRQHDSIAASQGTPPLFGAAYVWTILSPVALPPIAFARK